MNKEVLFAVGEFDPDKVYASIYGGEGTCWIDLEDREWKIISIGGNYSSGGWFGIPNWKLLLVLYLTGSGTLSFTQPLV